MWQRVLAFTMFFYCVAGELIVELEEVGRLLRLTFDQRQVEKRYIFARVAELGVGERLLDGL